MDLSNMGYFDWNRETGEFWKINSTDEYVKAFEKPRHVGETIKDGVRVSTVFLCLDHSFGGKEPVLFETVIFGGEHDTYMDRYKSLEEAKAGHAAACALVWGPE